MRNGKKNKKQQHTWEIPNDIVIFYAFSLKHIYFTYFINFSGLNWVCMFKEERVCEEIYDNESDMLRKSNKKVERISSWRNAFIPLNCFWDFLTDIFKTSWSVCHHDIHSQGEKTVSISRTHLKK